MNLPLIIKQGINKRVTQKPLIYLRSKRYKNRSLTIISSNCVGGIIYHDYGMRFFSPTINLYFENSDFIKFCNKLNYYLNLKLVESQVGNKEYPVGMLGDIKIHFLHYKTFNEAKTKWEERKNRIDKDNMIFILYNREPTSIIYYEEKMSNLVSPLIIFDFSDKMIDHSSNTCKIISIPSKYKDILFQFKGLSGKRYYEDYINIQDLFEIL